MTRLSVLVAGLCCALSASTASAVNIGFVPGDAFFHARLTYDWLHNDEIRPLSYSVPDTAEFAACGYAGYWSLTFKGNASQLRTHLKSVYEHMNGEGRPAVRARFNSDGERREWEIDSPRVFVYDRNFDSSFGIGFRFNENWWGELPRRLTGTGGWSDKVRRLPESWTSRPGPAGIYWPFRTSWQSVARDWKYADRVPGLTFEPPGVEGLWGDRISEPIGVDAKNIRIVVVKHDMLEDWDSPNDREAGLFDAWDKPRTSDWWFEVTVDSVTSRRETAFGEQTVAGLPDESAQKWLDLSTERWMIEQRIGFDADYDETADLAEVEARLSAIEQKNAPKSTETAEP